jgi:ABC-type branched-subunit amino acid transport system substrate-binding protein
MGITPVRTVIAPLATTDYTPFAAQAIQDNVNAVIVTGTEATAVPEAIAVRQQGFKGMIIGVSADISANAVSSLGTAAAGLYVIGQTKQPTTSDAAIKQFKADMTAVDPSAKQDELALVAWASVKLFAQVADHLKTVNASTVLKALQTAKVGTYKTGVTAPLPVAKTSPLKGYSRLGFDPTVTYDQVQNGVIQQTSSGYPNPFIVQAG